MDETLVFEGLGAVGLRRVRLPVRVRMVRPDHLEPGGACSADRRKVVGRIDLEPALRLGGDIFRAHRSDDVAWTPEQEPTALLRRGVPRVRHQVIPGRCPDAQGGGHTRSTIIAVSIPPPDTIPMMAGSTPLVL